MGRRVLLCLYFLHLLGGTLQLRDELPVDKWNEITVLPGRNSFSFGTVADPSQILTFSVHSPFNKIWASLLCDCPTDSSQYGYNLGLVSQRRIMNMTQVLYVCSFNSQPVDAAVRASLYNSEVAVPGGCGFGSTDYFSISTIVTHWMIEERNSENNISVSLAKRLNWWTSTIRFFAASPPHSTANSCASESQMNSSSLDKLIYHIYHIPLVTSGGFNNAYDNPSAKDVLSALGRLSSYGDAPLRGSLIDSVNARDLKLYEDNSYEIKISRHLGTASVINVIAEYKTASISKMESSTFVAYAPAVLYTCPHTAKGQTEQTHTESDRLACGLFDISVLTQFGIGIILLSALLFSFSGSYCVWLRCGVSIVMFSSFFSLTILYRFFNESDNVIYLIVASLVIPISIGCFLMLLIYFCCIRKSYVQGTVPLPPSIFNPTNGMESLTYTTYGAIGDSDDGCPDRDPSMNSLFPVRSCHRESPNIHLDSHFRPNEGVLTGTNILKFFFCCCYNRRLNQYRLWRLARLVPALPATLLLASFLMGSLINYLNALRNTTGHMCFFTFICVMSLALMYIYKNLAFGLSVALTGLYVSLTCVALMYFPNSSVPYILIDEFLIITWPEERLSVYDISVYGKNDIIFIVTWLCGSVVVGLMTMCLLRLNDSRDHNASRTQATGGLREILLSVSTRAMPAAHSVSGSRRWTPSRNLFRRRQDGWGPFTSCATPPNTDSDTRNLMPSLVDYNVCGTPPTPSHPVEEQQRQLSLHTSIDWPPQPLIDQPLASVPSTARIKFFDRQRPMHDTVMEVLPSPLIPMSRTHMEALVEVGAGSDQVSSLHCCPGDGHNPFESDDEKDLNVGES